MTGHALDYCEFDSVVLQDGAQPEKLHAANARHDDIRNNYRQRNSALSQQ